MRWLDGMTDSMDMRLSILREIVKDREGWHSAVDLSIEQEPIFQLTYPFFYLNYSVDSF